MSFFMNDHVAFTSAKVWQPLSWPPKNGLLVPGLGGIAGADDGVHLLSTSNNLIQFGGNPINSNFASGCFRMRSISP